MSKEERPKEIAKPCPNCGELHWLSELTHSSINSKYKGLVSTLYGVCKKCADNHSGEFLQSKSNKSI